MQPKLILKDGTEYAGRSFGGAKSAAGEVVFTTGMVGYPESLTDPSYHGQILIMTYPLVGNYGVPPRKYWESDKIQISGLVVSNYIPTPSHRQSTMSLGEWLRSEDVPALEIKDTRGLTRKLREKGVMLGKMILDNEIGWDDPNERNLVSEVSAAKAKAEGGGKKTIVLIDCGAKLNIARELLNRKVRLATVPWDHDFLRSKQKLDGVVISNGPGDPQKADKTIAIVREVLKRKIPVLGICLGNQILALAGGGSTYKLKFGHRGQNQPCRKVGTDKVYLTTQNHGFAIRKIPGGFKPWFVNANDGTNEGIIHDSLPFMSVQFHPEAAPGPVDTNFIFDEFLSRIK